MKTWNTAGSSFYVSIQKANSSFKCFLKKLIIGHFFAFFAGQKVTGDCIALAFNGNLLI